MMKNLVVDAWAILALLQKEEPAASRVRQLLENAPREKIQLFMSIINLGEVYYRVGKVKGEAEAQKTLEQISRLSLTILPATDERVLAAARWKIHHAISYADAFAAAAAAELKAILVTGDPELESLEEEIQIDKLSRFEA
jgi:predicted nucleic acid-binding protein